jgi:hypothetical protein
MTTIVSSRASSKGGWHQWVRWQTVSSSEGLIGTGGIDSYCVPSKLFAKSVQSLTGPIQMMDFTLFKKPKSATYFLTRPGSLGYTKSNASQSLALEHSCQVPCIVWTSSSGRYLFTDRTSTPSIQSLGSATHISASSKPVPDPIDSIRASLDGKASMICSGMVVESDRQQSGCRDGLGDLATGRGRRGAKKPFRAIFDSSTIKYSLIYCNAKMVKMTRLRWWKTRLNFQMGLELQSVHEKCGESFNLLHKHRQTRLQL